MFRARAGLCFPSLGRPVFNVCFQCLGMFFSRGCRFIRAVSGPGYVRRFDGDSVPARARYPHPDVVCKACFVFRVWEVLFSGCYFRAMFSVSRPSGFSVVFGVRVALFDVRVCLCFPYLGCLLPFRVWAVLCFPSLGRPVFNVVPVPGRLFFEGAVSSVWVVYDPGYVGRVGGDSVPARAR